MKILDIIQQEGTYALTMAIIHSLWQAIAILLLLRLLGLHSFFKKPGHRYYLYVSGLFILFICFIANFTSTFEGTATFALSQFETADEFIHSLSLQVYEQTGIYMAVHEIIAMLWLSGVVFFTLRFVLGHIHIKSILRHGTVVDRSLLEIQDRVISSLHINQKVRTIWSDKIKVPLTVGVWRPFVVFPLAYVNQLSPQQFESILIHELVHIKRQDFLINQFQAIIECILFFNPIAWHISNQAKKFREYHCDDIVQSQIPDKRIYLQALYKIARHSSAYNQSTVTLFNNKTELVMRVKRMLNQKTNEYGFTPFYSLTLFVFLMISLLSMNNIDSSAKNSDFQTSLGEAINMEVELPKLDVFHAELKAKDLQRKSHETGITFSNPQKVRLNAAPAKTLPSIQTKGIPKTEVRLEESLGFVSADTIPNEQKIQELEKRIAEKSKALEELGEKLGEEISQQVELDAKRIEELSKQWEERIAERMEKWEYQPNEEAVQRMEELARQLEKRISERFEGKDFERRAEMEPIERRIHELSKEMESLIDEDGKVKDEKRMDELKSQIKEESKKLQDISRELQEDSMKAINDEEIQSMKAEMQELAQKIAAEQSNYQQLVDPMSKELQEEIMKIQQRIQENMKPLQKELQQKMQEKALEIEKLARELEQARRGN